MVAFDSEQKIDYIKDIDNKVLFQDSVDAVMGFIVNEYGGFILTEREGRLLLEGY